MKVIKRDGRVVDYDKEKIIIAIQKANKEVRNAQKASDEDIEEIINYIEELDKKRILVEDIQDIIEEKLMEIGKFELAKKYIVYRYTRGLVRKANTADESILGLIRNENKESLQENIERNPMLASSQRDCVAGEVSRNLTKRILLPEKISKAHDEGVIYFHDSDYFIQHIFNCSLINLKDMLENGTVINNTIIESPKSFIEACNMISQIINAVESSQYGEVSVDLIHLGKYLKISHDNFEKMLKEYNLEEKLEKELVKVMEKDEIYNGVKLLQSTVNTLITANGHYPFVTFFLHIEKDDPYIKENAMIIEEILNQRYVEVKNNKDSFHDFPKLIYVLDDFNNLSGGKYDYLTKLALKCSRKSIYPCYISAKKMRENYKENVFSPMGLNNFLSMWKDGNGKYKWEGRFNQGMVTINIPQIAIIANNDEEKFWSELDSRLEICYEALMCRHYALLGTTAEISPILWQYGAIARLNNGEKIDSFLKDGYSTLSLGYIGIYEATKIIKGVSITDKEGHDFAIKIVKKLKETTKKWKEQTGLGFSLYDESSKNLCHWFASIDKKRFGIINGITDKKYYTSSYHLDSNADMNLLERLAFESEFQKISLGGGISHIELPDDENAIENMVKYVYDNIQYTEFDIKSK